MPSAAPRSLWFRPSTMVAVIDRLEGRDLVVRAPSPNDRRSYALRLSAHGKKVVADIMPRLREHETTIAGTLRAGPALATDGRFAVPGVVAAMLDRGTSHYSRIELARELEDRGLQLVVRASASTPTIVSFSAQGLAE